MNESPSEDQRSRPGLLRGLLIGLVIVLGALVIWALLSGGDDNSSNEDTQASVVSSAELTDIAASSEGPIYWAGESPGAELEYDESAGERVYVRYLTGGAEAGDSRPVFLTIATYPLADPADALRANARRTNTRLQRAQGGALVWVNPDRPQSVYMAWPDSEYQVEVYDPLPRRALQVALSGDITPLG